MKKVNVNFLISIFIIALVFIFSQNIHAGNNDKSTTNDIKWELYKEVNGVQIFYSTQECNDPQNGIFQELVFLKFVNTTEVSFKIDWDEELWYDNKCWTCNKSDLDRQEDHNSIELQAGESLVGVCTDRRNKELIIFSRYTNNKGVGLTKFEFLNLQVNPL